MAYTALNTGINQQKGITYAGTTATSADWGSVPADSYFYDLETDLPYYKNSSNTVVKVFEEGGGGDSIYTADGTVSADRIVSLNSNKLTFQNSSSKFKFEDYHFDIIADNDTAAAIHLTAGSNSISNGSRIEFYETSVYAGYAKSLIFRARKNEGSIKHLAYTNSTHCFYLANTYSATGDFTNINRRFEIGNNLTFFQNTDLVIAPNVTTGTPALIGSEDISLQGHTIVKGGGTTTGTTLALYDNDTTPSKTWEWLDNGNLNIEKHSTVNLNSQKLTFTNLSAFEINDALGITTGAKLTVNGKATFRSLSTDPAAKAILQLMDNTNAVKHEFRKNGTAFIGGGAAIASEDISLQGTVLINNTLDMNNNRILNSVINPSVQEAANSATFTINADEQSDGVLTAMSASTTIAAPTGTPVQSQDLVFRFKDDGTARSLTWNAIFRAIGVTLPTTTVASKLTYVGCKYNSTDSKWDVVAVQQEA